MGTKKQKIEIHLEPKEWEDLHWAAIRAVCDYYEKWEDGWRAFYLKKDTIEIEAPEGSDLKTVKAEVMASMVKRLMVDLCDKLTIKLRGDYVKHPFRYVRDEKRRGK